MPTDPTHESIRAAWNVERRVSRKTKSHHHPCVLSVFCLPKNLTWSSEVAYCQQTSFTCRAGLCGAMSAALIEKKSTSPSPSQAPPHPVLGDGQELGGGFLRSRDFQTSHTSIWAVWDTERCVYRKAKDLPPPLVRCPPSAC